MVRYLELQKYGEDGSLRRVGRIVVDLLSVTEDPMVFANVLSNASFSRICHHMDTN
jgi:hypothetical protein